MSKPEKSKKELVAEFLESPESASLTNKAIAERFGCDEGTVRRARQPNDSRSVRTQIAILEDKVKMLESELRQYRHNAPKPKRLKSEECPLWESPK